MLLTIMANTALWLGTSKETGPAGPSTPVTIWEAESWRAASAQKFKTSLGCMTL